MTDSRRSRALTAARIRLRSPSPRPLLDETRIDEVCAELLAMEAALKSLAVNADEYLDWLERGGKVPSKCGCGNPDCKFVPSKSPETASPATIATQGGSGHG